MAYVTYVHMCVTISTQILVDIYTHRQTTVGWGGGFGSMNMFEEMVAQNQDTTGQPKGKMNCMVGRLRCVACLWGCLPK